MVPTVSARRAWWLLALLGSACGPGYPYVRPDAFQPPPRNLAVLQVRIHPVENGILGGMLPISGDFGGAYQALRASLASIPGVRLVPDDAVAANPTYQSLPMGGFVYGMSPAPLRPVDLDPGALPVLAQQLNANLMVDVHFYPRVRASAEFLGVGTAHIDLQIVLRAYLPDSQPGWIDDFVVSSSDFARAARTSSPEDILRAVDEGVRSASAQVVGRLQLRLSGQM